VLGIWERGCSMVQWDVLSLRKASGGLNNSVNARDKRESEKGGVPAETKISSVSKRKNVSTLGGNQKTKQLTADTISVTDPHTKKTAVASLVSVRQNDANRQFARQNIITRGAIVEVTVDGQSRYSRVTSRPGQSGVVSGVLLSADESKGLAFEQKAQSKAVKASAKKPAKKAESAK
ncbi:MAG: 30S ribosomal protein S8e, partial [Candidatus Diapherotrites archaeon]|nr:30S ribosomal protein S8e [Candidatus Diapherotrites archaeon]